MQHNLEGSHCVLTPALEGASEAPLMFFWDGRRTVRSRKTKLGDIWENSIARRLVKKFWKSAGIFFTYRLSKSRLVFWDRDNHAVALDSRYCRPSGDVTTSYSEDLMARSPHMKVKVKVKGHRSRSYRRFQGHWPQFFRLDTVTWHNVRHVMTS